MKTVEFSDQEIQVLLTLVNVAVKTIGLDAAEAGLHFRNKLVNAQPVKVEENKG